LPRDIIIILKTLFIEELNHEFSAFFCPFDENVQIVTGHYDPHGLTGLRPRLSCFLGVAHRGYTIDFGKLFMAKIRFMH
jgi:hypothetical protein